MKPVEATSAPAKANAPTSPATANMLIAPQEDSTKLTKTSMSPQVLLVYLSACGGSSPTVSEETRSKLLYGANGTTPTVELQFRFCSHAKFNFSKRQIVPVKLIDIISWKS
jgi:hypothetical protein